MTRPIIKGGLKYGIIPERLDGALLNQRVGKFVFDQQEVYPPYFEIVLQTEDYLRQLAAFCADEANQPNVSSEEFESIVVPLPPRDEQEKQHRAFTMERKALAMLGELKCSHEERAKKILKRIWES